MDTPTTLSNFLDLKAQKRAHAATIKTFDQSEAQGADLPFLGKVIKAAELTSTWRDETPDELVLTFKDGSVLKISDEVDCCELRYMHTDDDLKDLLGCALLGFEIKKGTYVSYQRDTDDVHDIQFLEIKTDKGCVTMTSHNEHNGYYAGFNIKLSYQQET